MTGHGDVVDAIVHHYQLKRLIGNMAVFYLPESTNIFVFSAAGVAVFRVNFDLLCAMLRAGQSNFRGYRANNLVHQFKDLANKQLKKRYIGDYADPELMNRIDADLAAASPSPQSSSLLICSS
jgi:hypothetical protein